ncbi:uncharacterized protein [Fopius arisanus]|uniref:Htt_0 protein n=1 Tax=Fopius arisanus TaxID=64838 RepID=A0A0C9QPC4_9HYME|nr:PREDICTED: uncharacterized protein LOC105263242 [Fopius arisanus]
MDEAQICSSILEAYGCQVPDNKQIVELFRTRQEFYSDCSDVSTDEEQHSSLLINNYKNQFSSYKSKSTEETHLLNYEKFARAVFPKNVLMRCILEKIMKNINTGSTNTSTASTISDEFVEMPDDLDVLMRPGMIGKGIIENRPSDDGYRFFHHGVKQTITPRRYIMDNIHDEEFIFKKRR